MSAVSSRAPRGRRPGSPDTRAAILEAARARFAEGGFRATTIRAVAADAGVDAALVHHYFGTKDDLFVAAMELPVDPRQLLAPVLAGGVDGAAERFLGVFLSVWDDPELQPALLAVARGVMEPGGAKLLSEGFLPVVVRPIAEAVGGGPARAADAAGRQPDDRPDPGPLRAAGRAAGVDAGGPGGGDVRPHDPALPVGAAPLIGTDPLPGGLRGAQFNT